jgi:PAS domain S-box-containing protein
MLVLPRLTSHDFAAAVMRDLHLNWSWLAVLAGVGCVVIGLLHLMARLLPRIAANVEALQIEVAEHRRTEEALREARDELDERVRERTAELQRSNDALRASEERYARAAAGTNDGLWDWNIETDEDYFSPRWREILGYQEGELPSEFRAFVELLHPDDRERAEEAIRAHLEERKTYDIEFRLRRRDQSYVWVRARGQATWNAQGEPVSMAGSITDISQRKLMEAALQESEERFRRSFEDAGVGALMLRLDGRFQRVNRAFREMLGYSEQELLSKTFADISYPDDIEIGFQALREMIAGTRQTVHLEKRYLHKDGQTVWALVSASAIRNSRGEPLYTVAHVQNLSERKRAEEEIRTLNAELEQRVAERTAELARANETLRTEVAERARAEESARENEGRLRQFLDNTPAAASLKNLAGEFVMANDPFKRMMGIVGDDYRGTRSANYFEQDLVETIEAHDREVVESGRAVEREYEISTPDGDRTLLSVKFPVRDAHGAVTGIGAIAPDITERKRLEKELVRSERLAVLGQLTATVSHELRNPLGTMRSSMFVIDQALRGASERALRASERINRGIVRCDRIIDDLLGFTRTQASDRQPVVLDEWLAELLDELTVPDGIELARDLTAPGVSVEIDPEQMRRAVVNLYENAYQAVSDEHSGTAPGPRITVSSRLRGESFEIAVSDTGPGIPPDSLGSIFEPLFSTKSFGTGLGLPTVKQIVEGHGGTVEVENAEGRGVMFRLLVPLYRAGEAAA